MNRRRLPAALLLAALAVVLTPAAASAHPLGNFTTNQYAGLRVTAAGVDVDFVLDLAELPAYQARNDEIDTDGSGTVDESESDRYAASTCTAAGAASTVTIDGRVVPMVARPVALSFPPGAGGLTTLRLQCVLHADARPVDDTMVGFRDDYLADRIGWREVTAVGDRYTLERSTVPTASTSARLTAYPKGAPTSDIRTASLTVRPGGPAAAPFPGEQAFAPQARGADRLTQWFTGLVGHPQLTWGVGILAFLVAFVLGGAHAVAPGHGKTIMAAYLVGARGRMTQALTVAATVAATHTLGVLALGVVLATSLQLAPQHLYEWLRLASGVLVAAVGAQLLRGALRAVRARKAGLTDTPFHVHAESLAHAEYARAGVAHGEVVHSEVAYVEHPGGATGHSHPQADHEHVGAGHTHAPTELALLEHGLDRPVQTQPHEHEHAHGDTHPHGHGDDGESQSHGDGQPHEHTHGDTQAHQHGHGDCQAHEHGHGDTQQHEHGHGDAGESHSHGDGQLHEYALGHAQAHQHTHGDGQPHEHPHGDGHPHQHTHDGTHLHEHEHGVVGEPHSHGGGRAHTHYVPAPDEPFRVRTLLAMGFAGGLSPSPSAVVVLLGAAALGRAWYGVLLVLAYGIGLAAVLTGVGLALARWGERLRSVGSGRLARVLTHRLPTVTAAAILAVGIGMAALAINSLLTTTG